MKKLGKYILVAVLGIIFSIPVITLANAITSMHFVAFKLADDADVNVCKEFFKSFKQNFVQSLSFLVILLLFGFALGYLWFSAFTTGEEVSILALGMLLFGSIIYFNFESMSTYLLAKFENTTKRLLIVSIYAITKNLDLMVKLSLYECAMVAIPLAVYFINPCITTLIIASVIFFIMVVGFEMLSSKKINPIFDSLIKKREEEEAAKAEAVVAEDNTEVTEEAESKGNEDTN